MKSLQFIVVLVLICAAGLAYLFGLNMPKEGRNFIDRVFESANKKDFKTIYRDFSSGRFKASDDFAHFNKTMEDIYLYFGPIEGREQSRIMWDAYELRDFLFYRVEFDVQHKNGITHQRMVLMYDGSNQKWEIDGLAIASDEQVFLAQGNLFYFDWAGDIWSPGKVRGVYKDARSDFLNITAYSEPWFSKHVRKIKILTRFLQTSRFI